MTDLPHLIPVAMDVKGDYRLSVVLFDDLNRQDLAIHVLGNRNADTSHEGGPTDQPRAKTRKPP